MRRRRPAPCPSPSSTSRTRPPPATPTSALRSMPARSRALRRPSPSSRPAPRGRRSWRTGRATRPCSQPSRGCRRRWRTAAQLSWPGFTDFARDAGSLYVLGRGPSFPIAQETALKLKETCAIHAEAYSVAEVMHGPWELMEAGLSRARLCARRCRARDHARGGGEDAAGPAPMCGWWARACPSPKRPSAARSRWP